MSSTSFRAPDDRIGHGLDGPRDRELGHTELFADHRLRNVVVHVDQHHLQAFLSPMLGGYPSTPSSRRRMSSSANLAVGSPMVYPMTMVRSS